MLLHSTSWLFSHDNDLMPFTPIFAGDERDVRNKRDGTPIEILPLDNLSFRYEGICGSLRIPWSYAQLITNTTTTEANPLVYVV